MPGAFDVELRPTGSEDFAALRALFDEPSFRGWGGTGALSDEAIRAKYLGTRWPRVECYLVLRDAVPVGLAQLHEADEGGGIDLILVPEVRGRGVGRTVVESLVRRARDVRGWRRVTVDPDTDNIGAIRFWSAVGFRPVGRAVDRPDRPRFLLMEWDDR